MEKEELRRRRASQLLSAVINVASHNPNLGLFA